MKPTERLENALINLFWADAPPKLPNMTLEQQIERVEIRRSGNVKRAIAGGVLAAAGLAVPVLSFLANDFDVSSSSSDNPIHAGTTPVKQDEQPSVSSISEVDIAINIGKGLSGLLGAAFAGYAYACRRQIKEDDRKIRDIRGKIQALQDTSPA
jgi:hypothetical protein